MKNRRIVLSAGVPMFVLAAVIVSSGSAAAAVRPQNFGSEAWGWVVARQPTTTNYTPSGKDQGNSAGGTNTVHRNSIGDYSVKFGDLLTDNAIIHVSPLTTSPRICHVRDYGLLDQDFLVQVICRTRSGSLADSAFIVNVLSQYNLSDDMGYVATFPPSYPVGASYNSANQTNSVTKVAVGRWTVHLPGIGGAAGRGSVQVTAQSSTAAVCRVVSWTAGINAKVACRDPAGSLTDSGFMVTYMLGRGLKFAGDPNVAFVLADKPTTPSYSSTSGYRYSSAGQLPVIKRTGTGAYSVKLPGMPLGGSTQVSAYGSGSNRCVVASIRRTGLPQRVGVRCFSTNGNAADTKFTLHYAR